MRFDEIRTGKTSKRSQKWFFTPNFSKFKAHKALPPPYDAFLEVLAENRAFYFKRALHAGATHNK